jgi:hypothetical protein
LRAAPKPEPGRQQRGFGRGGPRRWVNFPPVVHRSTCLIGCFINPA